MVRLIDCIEAVAFDLDGTLIDTAPDLAAAANSMLRILGGRPLPEHSVAALIGDGLDRFVARVLEESVGASKLDATLQSWAHVLFRNLYEQDLFARGRVFPGVAQTLQVLENAALPLCCITNKESQFALPLLEAAGLRERFPVTVCADRPEDRKPSPEHAARRVPSAGRGACESAVRRRLSCGYCGGARGETAESWRSPTAIAITTCLQVRARTASSAI